MSDNRMKWPHSRVRISCESSTLIRMHVTWKYCCSTLFVLPTIQKMWLWSFMLTLQLSGQLRAQDHCHQCHEPRAVCGVRLLHPAAGKADHKQTGRLLKQWVELTRFKRDTPVKARWGYIRAYDVLFLKTTLRKNALLGQRTWQSAHYERQRPWHEEIVQSRRRPCRPTEGALRLRRWWIVQPLFLQHQENPLQSTKSRSSGPIRETTRRPPAPAGKKSTDTSMLAAESNALRALMTWYKPGKASR